MDEWDTDNHNDGHDKGGPLREATPPDLQGDIRKLQVETLHKRITAVLQLSEKDACPILDLQALCRKTHIHPVQGQQISHTKVCQLRTGAFHHQSALPNETRSHEQSKDVVHTNTKETYNQTRQQKASPHSIDIRMGHTYRTWSWKTTLFKETINFTSHNQQQRK